MAWLSRLFSAKKTTSHLPANQTPTVTVYKNNKMHVLQVSVHETLLASMQGAGIDIAYSCEEGLCGSCQCLLVEGQVTMKHNQFLTKEELAKGDILCCQAYPLSSKVTLVFE